MFIGCKDRLNYRKCDTPEAKERIKKNMRGSFFHILFIIIYVVTMGFEIPKGDVKIFRVFFRTHIFFDYLELLIE